MPNRILREGILTSAKVCSLRWPEEILYRRLMSVVDDYGRYHADEGLLRAACYPRQLNKVSDSDIGKWLTALVEAALVRVYPASDGERYLELLNFGQHIRAKKSKYPDPQSTCNAHAVQVRADALVDVCVDEDEDESMKSAAKPLVPRCPHEQLIDIFAEHLPMLPKPRTELWKGTRARDMRNRWRWVLTAKKRSGKAYAETPEAAIDFFRRFFGYVARSDFLTGRNGKWPGCTLAWLMEEPNFAKVMEGNYDNPEGEVAA